MLEVIPHWTKCQRTKVPKIAQDAENIVRRNILSAEIQNILWLASM